MPLHPFPLRLPLRLQSYVSVPVLRSETLPSSSFFTRHVPRVTFVSTFHHPSRVGSLGLLS